MKLHLFFQILKQSIGLVCLEVKYRNGFPEPETHQSNIKYSLPFTGSWTVINGGLDKDSSHSWDIPTQRYAYDVVMLNDDGTTFSGDITNKSNYLCYGQDVLAPADGVVAELSTGNPDSHIDGENTPCCDGKDIRGNYVLIKHAEREYSLLAHLMPNSINVCVGQKIKRREVIGRCGNSGNTSEPHLHFHLQDGRSFYTSAGLPIQFENISAVPFPNYASIDERGVAEDTTGHYPPYIARGLLVSNQPSE